MSEITVNEIKDLSLAASSIAAGIEALADKLEEEPVTVEPSEIISLRNAVHNLETTVSVKLRQVMDGLSELSAKLDALSANGAITTPGWQPLPQEWWRITCGPDSEEPHVTRVSCKCPPGGNYVCHECITSKFGG